MLSYFLTICHSLLFAFSLPAILFIFTDIQHLPSVNHKENMGELLPLLQACNFFRFNLLCSESFSIFHLPSPYFFFISFWSQYHFIFFLASEILPVLAVFTGFVSPPTQPAHIFQCLHSSLLYC